MMVPNFLLMLCIVDMVKMRLVNTIVLYHILMIIICTDVFFIL